MALFGFGKKKEQTPAPKPEPKKEIKIDAPPYEYYVMVNGQWVINPNYDPSAPKPPKIYVIGMDDDDDESEKEEEDDDF